MNEELQTNSQNDSSAKAWAVQKSFMEIEDD